mgnify:CR=1 FL=1
MSKHKERELECLLERADRLFGNEEALFDGNTSWSYSAYAAHVRRIAGVFSSHGYREGQRIALLGETSLELIACWIACWRLGITCVPINTRLPRQRAQELAKEVNCSLALVSYQYTATKGSWEATPSLVIEEVFASKNTRAHSIKTQSSMDATIIFTSGSTGHPKAALHSLDNHLYSAMGAHENMPFGPGDRWLLSLPLYHVGGLAILVRALWGGGAVVFTDKERPLHEALTLDITHASMVATQLYRLLQHPEALASCKTTLKAILVGGGAVPRELLAQSHECGLPLCTTYGMTELSSQLTTTAPGAPYEDWMTSGQLLPHRKLKLHDDGEIWAGGETLFRGYLTKDGLHDLRNEQGWFQTGDIGQVDEKGRLSVIGRKDNMFISGGENIHPETIEQAFERLEGVIRALVVDRPDVEFGARPVVFVELEDGKTLEGLEWREQLTTHLARYQMPDACYSWPEGEEYEALKPKRASFRRLAANLHLDLKS